MVGEGSLSPALEELLRRTSAARSPATQRSASSLQLSELSTGAPSTAVCGGVGDWGSGGCVGVCVWRGVEGDGLGLMMM